MSIGHGETFRAVFVRAPSLFVLERVLEAVVPPCTEAGASRRVRDGAVDCFVLAPAEWRVTAVGPFDPAVLRTAPAAYAAGALRVWVFEESMEETGPRLVPRPTSIAPRRRPVLPQSSGQLDMRW